MTHPKNKVLTVGFFSEITSRRKRKPAGGILSPFLTIISRHNAPTILIIWPAAKRDGRIGIPDFDYSKSSHRRAICRQRHPIVTKKNAEWNSHKVPILSASSRISLRYICMYIHIYMYTTYLRTVLDLARAVLIQIPQRVRT